jgi:hypothetical protein
MKRAAGASRRIELTVWRIESFRDSTGVVMVGPLTPAEDRTRVIANWADGRTFANEEETTRAQFLVGPLWLQAIVSA